MLYLEYKELNMIDFKEIDKTIELWNSIPNNPSVLDEECSLG